MPKLQLRVSIVQFPDGLEVVEMVALAVGDFNQ